MKWWHTFLRRFSWYQRWYNAQMFWYAVTLSFEQFQPDPAFSPHDDYCWMHTPGGWTCLLCRESEGQP